MVETALKSQTVEKSVTVEGRTLHAALKVARAVIERHPIHILSCVKIAFDAEEKGLTISATDLDNEVTLEVDDIDGVGTWEICIAADLLASIASVAGMEPMTLAVQHQTRTHENRKTGERTIVNAKALQIVVGDGSARYTIDDTLPASDFPEPRALELVEVERFTNGMLASAFQKVAWGISTEETRYYLNGICWRCGPEGRRFIATNGHVMAMFTYCKEASEPAACIIPRKAVSFITRHFKNCDVTVFGCQGVNQSHIEVRAPGIRFRAKLIDGTFPDVDRVIPSAESLTFQLQFNAFEILQDIKKTVAIGATAWRSALQFAELDGKASLRITSQGEWNAQVKTRSDWPADAKPIGFNSSYLMQIFGSCVGQVTLSTHDVNGPATIIDSDPDMLRVCMPMRI